jgi:arylsulfatase A
LERSLKYGGVARPEHDISPNKRYYYGTVDQLDDAFGRLVQGLDEAGEGEETLVVFTSDNGPEAPVNSEESRGEWEDPSRDRSFGTPGPWRGMKRYPYEGGHRVPGIIRWPGRVEAGSVNETLVNGTDLMPTLASLAGVALPERLVIDGVDVGPALRGLPVHREKPVFWLFPAHEDTHYRMPHIAMRDGPWALLGWLTPKLPEERIMDWLKSAGIDRFALFDLDTDPSQEHDVVTVESARVERMASQMRAFWNELQAEGPYWDGWTMK